MGSAANPAGLEPTGDTAVPSNARRHVRLGLVVTAGVVLSAVAFRLLTTRSWPLWDLDVYIEGARAVADHGDLYSVTAHGLPFTYPPFAAVAFIPLAAAGGSAGLLLSLLSVASFVVVGLVVSRQLTLSVPVTAVVLVGTLVLEPITRTLVLGQINAVLMALVVLDLFVLPSRWRGTLIGLAAGIKLTPAIFVVYLLLKREYPSAARMVGSFLGTVIIGWLIGPQASLSYWSGHVLALDNFGDFQVQPANQSLRGGLIRLLHTSDAPTLLWIALGVMVLALAVWAAARRINAGDDVGAMLSLAVCGLLISPISWTHHWVWVLPGILYAVAARRLMVAWVLGAVFYLAPMWLLPSGGGIQLNFTAWQLTVSVTYVLVGLAGLLLLGLLREGIPAE